MTEQPTRAPRKRAASKRAAPKRTSAVSPAADVAVAEPVSDPPAPQHRFVALRKMTVKNRVVLPGELVPEAESWPRVESWVRARYIKEV